jgi:ABC-type multidrug transport system fused ATPase/permease subunit
LMTQILNGIRIVKYFVWESSVKKEVDTLRKKELQRRWQLVRAESFASVGYIAVSVLVLFVTFAIHVWRGGAMEASSVFTAVALFQLLADPFGHISQLVSRVVYAMVGAERILKFLGRERLSSVYVPMNQDPVAISIEDVSVQLSGRSILSNINIQLEAGKSLAIVGPVGSGKTTLLHVLLGEQPIASGKIGFSNMNGETIVPRFAYVPQEAYIINDTLKENILFGNTAASVEDFSRAIELASLGRDISALPAGLYTEIGERGVNLSGGQKQRVSLARAILHEPSIAILDDPLSAVEPSFC